MLWVSYAVHPVRIRKDFVVSCLLREQDVYLRKALKYGIQIALGKRNFSPWRDDTFPRALLNVLR